MNVTELEYQNLIFNTVCKLSHFEVYIERAKFKKYETPKIHVITQPYKATTHGPTHGCLPMFCSSPQLVNVHLEHSIKTMHSFP